MANQDPKPPKPVVFRTLQIPDVATARFQQNVKDTLDSLVAAVLDLQTKVTGSA